MVYGCVGPTGGRVMCVAWCLTEERSGVVVLTAATVYRQSGPWDLGVQLQVWGMVAWVRLAGVWLDQTNSLRVACFVFGEP